MGVLASVELPRVGLEDDASLAIADIRVDGHAADLHLELGDRVDSGLQGEGAQHGLEGVGGERGGMRGHPAGLFRALAPDPASSPHERLLVDVTVSEGRVRDRQGHREGQSPGAVEHRAHR